MWNCKLLITAATTFTLTLKQIRLHKYSHTNTHSQYTPKPKQWQHWWKWQKTWVLLFIHVKAIVFGLYCTFTLVVIWLPICNCRSHKQLWTAVEEQQQQQWQHMLQITFPCNIIWIFPFYCKRFFSHVFVSFHFHVNHICCNHSLFKLL